MNERIADLSRKAHMLATIAANDLTGPHHCKIGSDYFLALKEEKFATLLIQSAINVCLEQRDPQNLNYKPSEKFADALRQRFGVS